MINNNFSKLGLGTVQWNTFIVYQIRGMTKLFQEVKNILKLASKNV